MDLKTLMLVLSVKLLFAFAQTNRKHKYGSVIELARYPDRQ